MRRGQLLVALAVVMLIAASAAAQKPAASAPVVGTWFGPTEVPDQGTDQITLTISKTDTGIAGTISDSLGVIAGTTEIKDVAFGLLLGLAAAKIVPAALFGTGGLSLFHYVAIALTWLAIAVAACLVPARRAARLDPVSALRCE